MVEGYNEGITPDGCPWRAFVKDGAILYMFIDSMPDSMEDMLRQLPGFQVASGTPVTHEFGAWTNFKFITEPRERGQ